MTLLLKTMLCGGKLCQRIFIAHRACLALFLLPGFPASLLHIRISNSGLDKLAPKGVRNRPWAILSGLLLIVPFLEVLLSGLLLAPFVEVSQVSQVCIN